MARRATAKLARKGTKKSTAAKSAPVKPPKRPMAVVPRIGVLTPDEFEAAASDALGGRGWQKSWRAGTGFAQSTLTRYLRGVLPIPQHVAVIVEMLQTLRSHGLPIPEAFISKN